MLKTSQFFHVFPCTRNFELLRFFLLVLDLRLDVLDGVIWLDVQGNHLSGEDLDEDLHGTTSKSEDKM